MIKINAPLRSKMGSLEYDRCQVDITVTLPHSEFEYFRCHTCTVVGLVGDRRDLL